MPKARATPTSARATAAELPLDIAAGPNGVKATGLEEDAAGELPPDAEPNTLPPPMAVTVALGTGDAQSSLWLKPARAGTAVCVQAETDEAGVVVGLALGLAVGVANTVQVVVLVVPSMVVTPYEVMTTSVESTILDVYNAEKTDGCGLMTITLMVSESFSLIVEVTTWVSQSVCVSIRSLIMVVVVTQLT